MSTRPTSPTGKDDMSSAPEELKFHGLLAEYETVGDLMTACEKVRDAGYTKWDAHTPFPVHGIDDAMGIKPTILPWFVLVGGLVGLGAATGMQWWMNAVDYPFLVSGKPYFSLPACVPIMFELTVLFAALTTFLGVLVLNLLPQPYHPLFRSERFKRATNDRFFISIDGADPLFARERTHALLVATGPSGAIEEVMDEATPAPFPKAFFYVIGILACATFIPLGSILKARFATTDTPRIHLVWDMDWQKKFKAQTANPFFADGRAMRPPVPGTVARGDYRTPDEMPFFSGKNADGSWVSDFPIAVDDASMARGKERFGIYCAPCHGLTGGGGGIIDLRAQRTMDSGNWVPPLSYHSDALRDQPIGQLFATITNGIRTMPSYGAQIGPDDRWKIVLYVRALQRSQFTSFQSLSPQDKAQLSGK